MGFNIVRGVRKKLPAPIHLISEHVAGSVIDALLLLCRSIPFSQNPKPLFRNLTCPMLKHSVGHIPFLPFPKI